MATLEYKVIEESVVTDENLESIQQCPVKKLHAR